MIMGKLALLLLFLVSGGIAMAQLPQTDLNYGFEYIVAGKPLPERWVPWGTDDYQVVIDTLHVRSGRYAVCICPLVGKKSEESFGALVQPMMARYQGDSVRVSAYMKLEDIGNGYAGLLVRVDDENNTLQFTNMLEQKIHGTRDWKLYTVTLPWPENAKMFYFGALTNGNGRLWIDDFKVEIDGKDITPAVRHFKAEEDHEFDRGSGLMTIDPEPRVAEHLAVLARVWGFVKYHHPFVADGNCNMDYELFRLLPRIISCKTPEERNGILSAWIDGMGEVKQVVRASRQEQVKQFPDYSWITPAQLGATLSDQLTRLIYTVRPEEQYYVSVQPFVGNPVFLHESLYPEMSPQDAGLRLLCLFRYWNVIQYYSPYKYLIGEDWHKVLEEFIPVFLGAHTRDDYRMAMIALFARVRDSHANLGMDEPIYNNIIGKYGAPLVIRFVEGQAVVCNYAHDRGKTTGMQPGDVLLEIDGRPVAEIVKEKLPYTPASNNPTQLRNIAEELLRSNRINHRLTYKRNGKLYTVPIEYLPREVLNIRPEPDTCFRMLTPDIAWLYPGKLQPGDIARLIPVMSKTQGLVIDLRCYPSDFIVFSLGNFLHARPEMIARFASVDPLQPGKFVLRDGDWVGENRPDVYKGKVVILVDEITQSNAEYSAMAFRSVPGARVVGSTTAGADGNVSWIYLPGYFSAAFSGIGVYYPDGRETQRVGILPDIEVKPTLKGIREGRDEVLEKALELLRQ